MKTLLLKPCTAALIATSAMAATVHTAELHVMSSGGFAATYKVLGPKFAVQTGNSLNTAFGPPMDKSSEAIPNRFARGKPADAVIMVSHTLNDLIKQDKIIPGSRVELADSRIGMVVREGAAKPDISSPEAFKHVLLHTKSVTYSDSASSVYIECELFERLGIEGRAKAKAKMIPRIPATSVVATDDYEVGFQQMSELLPVPGATFVGKIPKSLQSMTRYAADIPVGAQHPKEAKALFDCLTSPAVQADVKSAGPDSVPG